MARRFWNAKDPEKVTKEQIDAMTPQQQNTWEIDRYRASHGTPRSNKKGDDDYDEDTDS